MADKTLLVKVRSIFSAAANRVNLVSGEDLEVSLGKISKWLSDLKTVAFTGSYNDLTDKPSIPSSAVTGVKGNSESNYRTGNVNITSSDILGYTPVDKAGDTLSNSLHFEPDTGYLAGIQGPTGVPVILFDDSGSTMYIGRVNGGASLMTINSTGIYINGYKIATLNDIPSAAVTGVKGNTETNYRTGNVNITAANIGAVRYDTSSQGLTATQKSNARTNLGLGTAATYSSSSFASSTQGGYATDFNSNFKPIFTTSGQSHASVFRGKYLGSSFTSAQKAAIADGSFDDLFVGDYWTIGGRNWRIADIDYINSTTHHLIIMPDTALYNTQFNTTSTSSSGYVGSNLYSGLSTALSTINSAFGSSYIMEHSTLLTNAVSSGVPTGWSNYNVKVNIPTQSMLCGHRSQVYSGNDSRNDGCNFSQLNLFRVAKKYLSTVSGWTWTSDCVATAGAAVYNGTNFNTLGVTGSYGVRPYFCLKGA